MYVKHITREQDSSANHALVDVMTLQKYISIQVTCQKQVYWINKSAMSKCMTKFLNPQSDDSAYVNTPDS